MKITPIILAASAVLAAPAVAQPMPPGPDTLAFARSELAGSRIVKGAPFCADVEQEAIQTLADGNRIVRRQQQRLCRDGEGRLRQELNRGEAPARVYLRDPVAGQSWWIDPQGNHVRTLGPGGAGADSAAWREYGDRMREWARSMRDKLRTDPNAAPPTPPAPPAPPVAPSPALISRDEHGAREVRVMRIEAPPQPMLLPPGVAQHLEFGAPRGAGVTTGLGARDIEGLRAHGERTTWTIEAGRVGNEKPIQITRDVWTSPDLMLPVLVRDADPRSGEQVWRLANVKRGEPDPALMRPPAEAASTDRR